MAAGLSKMLRRFSIDTAGSHHKTNKTANFNISQEMDWNIDTDDLIGFWKLIKGIILHTLKSIKDKKNKKVPTSDS